MYATFWFVWLFYFSNATQSMCVLCVCDNIAQQMLGRVAGLARSRLLAVPQLESVHQIKDFQSFAVS